MLKDNITIKDVSINEETNINQQNSSNDSTINENKDYIGHIRNGVEVVDVKIVPKIGIPTKENRTTWDKL